MKQSCRLFLVLLGAVAPIAPSAHAEELTREIKFSDPSKPGTLKISLARGDLEVRGVDVAVATATVKSDSKPARSTPRKDGLRELSGASTFHLTENENVITLDATGDGVRTISDLNVTVPRNTSLIVSNSWGGDITCIDVGGDLEVKNMNGRIKLEGVAGSVLVEAMNGEISAQVRELRDGKPLSFTSMNGEILIRLPADAKANVRLRSQNGSILTDFDEKALVTKTESAGKWRTPARNSEMNPRRSKNRDGNEEIHTVVKEAVRAGLDAVQDAASAMREATLAAKEAVDEARMSGNDSLPMPARPPLPPMTGGKIVTGTLNQGGPEIQAASMNGDVTLRKMEATK